GTGIIGAIVSYPVMAFLWGREGLTWLFYVPSFICGTLIGGSIAALLLYQLQRAGVLRKMQDRLSGEDEVCKETAQTGNL
nr:energy coupling factor transporter S component ThiW [Lachnospiraceae bacterium]